MILIKKIEFIETICDPVEIVAMNHPHQIVPIIDNDGPTGIECSVLHELCHGRRFVRPSDGTDVTIAMSQQAADLIGIQYEAWQNLETAFASETSAHTKALKRIQKLESELKGFRQAGFWERLKMVFTDGKTKLAHN